MIHQPAITLLLSFVLLFTKAPKAYSQSLPDTTVAKIDQLFSKWNNPNEPGCAAGIVKDGQLIYAKGFGLANLETTSPITPSTIFYMCSVSKQFAGYAIAMLVNKGKINLDEDIRTYLPWLSDFGGQKITVSHLLHHTSGIRDDIWMSQLYGLGSDGMLTEDQAIRLLQKQHTLNFTPGEKFSYSNSNFILLAEIVKSVTGQPLTTFADSAIFKPLGMTSTAFIDDPAALIPNRALSYLKEGNVFHNATQNVYTLGDGGLFTNVNDMAKWVNNFFTPKAGTQQDLTLMTTPGTLNDGSPNTYAMGIDVTDDRGNKRFIHNGGLEGYRTIVSIYPDSNLGIFIFGNGGDGDAPNKLYQIAELLIPGHNKKKEEPTTPTYAASTSEMMKWPGNYVSQNGMKAAITFKEGKLYLNGNTELTPEAKDVFHLKVRPAVKYHFSENTAILTTPVLPRPLPLKKIKDIPLTPNELEKYTGKYWSDELESTFIITLKNDKLWINDKFHNPVEITPMGTEHLYTGYDFLYHLLVIRNKNGAIKGFELNSGNNANLIFNKIPSH